MTERKFYRTVFTFEIISHEPYPDPLPSLEAIHIATMEGDDSGMFLNSTREEIDGATAAKLLLAQGSDPEFFELTTEGEDSQVYLLNTVFENGEVLVNHNFETIKERAKL